jgi:hypothetical protein
MLSREQLAAQYLDFVNNYLTVDKFAEHRGLTPAEGQTLIDLGKSCHNNLHPEA